MIKETYNFVNHWKHYSFDDPCEVCLVRPCCKVACKDYKQYWAFQDYKARFIKNKKFNITIIVSSVISVLGWIALMIKFAMGG